MTKKNPSTTLNLNELRVFREVRATDLEDGSLPDESFGQVLARKLPRRLQLLVPVPRLPGDVLLVPETGGECWKNNGLLLGEDVDVLRLQVVKYFVNHGNNNNNKYNMHITRNITNKIIN